MLFNSYAFVGFFLVVVPLYYLLPLKRRYLWLLVASCYFYMALIPSYILFLFLLIAIDFVAGIWMERYDNPRRRRILVISLTANLLLLGVFKYFNFFADLSASAAHWMGYSLSLPHLSLLLPLGLSFHTFQSMAYTIDVYRRRVPAERHLGYYALYVMFFPQLVAGPIERPQHLLPQLHHPAPFDPPLAIEGLRLILWGYFKKMVIADHLARWVDPVYHHSAQATAGALWLATYFFAFQIYCDFSGYTDIARGVARVLGVRLMENFKTPYQAASIVDFWRRWHISLSTWFRDYVYIPLGGSFGSLGRTILNVLIVFFLSGLWHGANLTFVVWGIYHGILVIAYRASSGARAAVEAWCGRRGLRAAWNVVSMVVTFQLVSLGWVFFRAASLRQALAILARMLWLVPAALARRPLLPFLAPQVVVFLGLITLFTWFEWFASHQNVRRAWLQAPTHLRWLCYYTLLVLVVAYGNWGERQFIYFQF